MDNPQKSNIPIDERISPVRSEDIRQKAPGNLLCHKCNSERLFVSEGGNRQVFLPFRLFFVVYRCHTCGTLSRHTRIGHVLRSLFGSAKRASMNMLESEPDPAADSPQSKEFRPIKRDSNPVFRRKVTDATPISALTEEDYDPDSIVREIRSKYTLAQRELISSRFEEIAYLIKPDWDQGAEPLRAQRPPDDSNPTNS